MDLLRLVKTLGSIWAYVRIAEDPKEFHRFLRDLIRIDTCIVRILKDLKWNL